jgi:hypothetical protein
MPSGSSAAILAPNPRSSSRRSGLPPRSCVHAAARKPTASTGLITGATNTPISGTTSTTRSSA